MTQLDLFSPATNRRSTPRYPAGPGFKERGGASQAAAAAIAPSISDLAMSVLSCLEKHPMTADEIAEHLGRDRLAILPRLSELRAQQLVTKTNLRRPNQSGLMATVWRLT